MNEESHVCSRRYHLNDLKAFARERERERNGVKRANALSKRKKTFAKLDFFSFAVTTSVK